MSVQSLNHLRLFSTSRTATCQASLSITNLWSLLQLMSIKSGMPSNHLILCCPLLLLVEYFSSVEVPQAAYIFPLSPSATVSSPCLITGSLFLVVVINLPLLILPSVSFLSLWINFLLVGNCICFVACQVILTGKFACLF